MFQTLFTIATQLTEDIKLAKSKLQERKGTNLSQMFPIRDSNGREFSTINCVDQWFLHAEEPFIEGLDLRSAVDRWYPNPVHTPSVQAVSLFRLLLQKMTDPPTAIQKYVVRASGKAGRDKTLKPLPTNVEAVLIDFALDMLGYGWPEIRNPAGVELENSRFFTSLGKTFEERNAELRILIEQRLDWKMLINKALQLALRDIRNYEYGEVNGVPQWIKNKRQKKDVELRSDGDRDLNNN